MRVIAPLALFVAEPAWADKRVALVIGNSEYETTTQLANPVNDAKAVAQLLSTVGFEVVSAANLGRDDMRQVVGDFVARISAAGPDTVALVFYAGHGLQVEGENFLVPVDAKLTSETDVPDQALRLLDVMKALEQAPARMRIVILDACRNNPFSDIGDAGGRGLAMVDAPSGTIVAYSTAPGTEALDGKGRHSPYAAAFMRNVKRPNLPIEQFFKKVRLLVNESTEGAQTPWESSSLTADFSFIGPETLASAERPPEGSVASPAAPPPSAPPAAAPVPLAELRTRPVREAYEIVVEEDRVEYYEEFVRLYPDDPLCDRIRRQLSRRQQMIAWHRTVQQNSRDAYQSFAQSFPASDLSRTAQRLQERPRLVSLPVFEARPPIVVRPLPNRPPFGGNAGTPRPGGPIGSPGNPRPGGPVVGIPNDPRPGPGGGNPGRPGPVVNNTPTGPIVVNPNGPRPGGPVGGATSTPQQGGTPNTPRPGGPVANNNPTTPTGPIVVNPNGPRPGGPVGGATNTPQQGGTSNTPRPGGPVANNNPATPTGPIVVNPNGPRPGGPVGGATNTPQQGGTSNTPRPGGPVANNNPATPTGPIVVNPNGPRPGGPVGGATNTPQQGGTPNTPRPGGPVANNNPTTPTGPIVVNPNGPRPGGPVGGTQTPQRPGPVANTTPTAPRPGPVVIPPRPRPGGGGVANSPSTSAPPNRPPVVRPAPRPRPSQATSAPQSRPASRPSNQRPRPPVRPGQRTDGR